MRRRVAEIGKFALSVGIIENKQHEGSSLTVAELGAVHEYGSPAAGIEARPWLGFTFQNRRRALAEQLERLTRSVLAGSTTAIRAMSQVGEFTASAVKRSISQRLIRQELAESTLTRRAQLGQGDAALYATEQLYDAVGFKIDKVR